MGTKNTEPPYTFMIHPTSGVGIKDKSSERVTVRMLHPTSGVASTTNLVHTNVICDGCGINPIRQIRYKCVTCKDFDLCNNCFAKGIHNYHDFLAIRKT